MREQVLEGRSAFLVVVGERKDRDSFRSRVDNH